MDLNKFLSSEGFGHYSPEDVEVLIGTLSAYGFPDSEFVSIVKDTPLYTTTTTTDGKHHRLKHNDDKHTLRLTLSGMSDFNSVLTKIAIADDYTDKVLFPIIIKDGLGNSIFVSNTAWIEEAPETVYSDTDEPKVWVFKCTGCSYTIGGGMSRASVGKNIFDYLVGLI